MKQSRVMRTITTAVALGMFASLTVLGASLTTSDDGADAGQARPPLPEGSSAPGENGAAETAIQIADELGAVPNEDGDTCSGDHMNVSWSEPAPSEEGSYLSPVGPAPDEDTRSVNGVIRCDGNPDEYVGFSARYDGHRWSADLTPIFNGDPEDGTPDAEYEFGEGETGEEVEGGPAPAPSDPLGEAADQATGAVDQATAGGDADGVTVVGAGQVEQINALNVSDNWTGLWEPEIEPLSPYEPQQVCAPSEKPGPVAFRDLVMAAFPYTGRGGISRACDVGGRSEHKEGRAWDWGANVGNPPQREAAAQVIGWLLATDEHDNQYAMARRLGVMYIIYNRSIWRSYAADQGWVPYNGPSPHTDHVHISYNLAGAAGATSFWRIPDLAQYALGGFGPTAILPEAGGISTGGVPGDGEEGLAYRPPEDARPDPRPEPRDPTFIPFPSDSGGGGGSDGGDGGGDLPPVPSVPTLPTPTLPALPNPGGLLPECPEGTPVFPLPTHCVLPDELLGDGGGVVGGGGLLP